jgi:ATP-dependent exoDNAse (exonuclease V) alpha subunit
MFKQTIIESETLNRNFKELLSSFLDDTNADEKNSIMKALEIGSGLSKSQSEAFELFKKGESLLILGSAGVGKSRLIKTMYDYNNQNEFPKNMYLCATTGIAAYNIGGMTIHSFMGIGAGDKSIDFLIRRVYRNKALLERLKKTEILIIDEISMLSAILLEKIDLLCQHFRKNKTFFGGIQVIFTGDLLQLLPVFNQNEKLIEEPEDTRLIIESPIFNKIFNKKNKNVILLKENFRQKGDSEFLNLLLRIRSGIYTEQDIIVLQNKCKNFKKEHNQISLKGIIPIHLVTTNSKAQIINESNLKKLKTPEHKYRCNFNCSGSEKDIIDILKNELDFQFKQKGLIELKLRKNARVMLIKNIDVSIGLVNGSIGTIIDFTSNKDPVVLFDNGIQKIIEKVEWELEMNDNKVKAHQIPLILAYAITIHKSQSLTLEHAILDLDKCFCDHQLYVGLSRIKNFEGILLLSFNANKIMINEKMINYLKTIENN